MFLGTIALLTSIATVSWMAWKGYGLGKYGDDGYGR